MQKPPSPACFNTLWAITGTSKHQSQLHTLTMKAPVKPHPSAMSSSGLQSTRHTWIYWNKSREGLWKWRDETFLHTMRAWGCWNCSAWEERLRKILPTCLNRGWDGVKNTEPNSSQNQNTQTWKSSHTRLHLRKMPNKLSVILISEDDRSNAMGNLTLSLKLQHD